MQPGVGHVVAVAHPRHHFAFEAVQGLVHIASVLDEGEDVGQDLAGVKLVGQTIDDRHPRIGGEAFDLGLLVGADHHQVHHAADDFGTVVDGFRTTELGVAGGQVHHRTAHLVHARLKADAGAGRGLLENHGQGAVHQRLVFVIGLELGLDQRGTAEQISVVIGRRIAKVQIVFHRLAHVRPWLCSKSFSPKAPRGPPLHRLPLLSSSGAAAVE